MNFSRRDLLGAGGFAAFAAFAGSPSRSMIMDNSPAVKSPAAGRADYDIRIGTGLVELNPDTIVSTTLYNGTFPGPLLRLTEGKRVAVDIHNDTATPEQLHWHGQFLPPDVDGAAEEGTPFIPPRGMRRISFVPGPSGFRFFHTHLTAGSNLSLGLYNGEDGARLR